MRGACVLLVLLGLARVVSAGVVVERVGIEVMPTDPKGKVWDSDRKHASPDPQIEVRFGGKKVVRCKTVDDAMTAECIVPAHDPAAVIELSLHVTDVDRFGSEDIGAANLTIASGHEGRVELGVTGRLARAWADVRSTREPWPTRTVAWGIAAVAGCALALLLYALLRERFLSPAVADRKGSGFWSSPALVTGMASAMTGFTLGTVLLFSERVVHPLVGAIPMALGVFSVSVIVIDIYRRRRLTWHLQVLSLGSSAALLAPGAQAFSHLWTIGVLAIAVGVIVLLGWLT